MIWIDHELTLIYDVGVITHAPEHAVVWDGYIDD